MKAYYNENDPFTAAWLRELIKADLIAQGDVDERSIEDIRPSELKGYVQCHFFAGIGVWSYALRQAGWPDHRPVWTGSCPCQPFSAAGQRRGFADERHLWPSLFWLIQQSRPDIFFGEQIAAKDGLTWFDAVSTDLESADYAVGAIDSCAAGFGAPHIRQRLYFVADSTKSRRPETGKYNGGSPPLSARFAERRGISELEKSGCAKWAWGAISRSQQSIEKDGKRPSDAIGGSGTSDGSLVNPKGEQMGVSGRSRQPRSTAGNADDTGSQRRGIGGDSANKRVTGPNGLASQLAEPDGGNACSEGLQRGGKHGFESQDSGIVRSATGGFWRDYDWIPCIDSKSRPVEPGTFPLAHGVANRVGLLRGYGNSLVAPQATAFIEAYMECN